MIQQVSKEIKITDYTLNRLVCSGTDHFKKLAVVSGDEVKKYQQKVLAFQKLNKQKI